MCGASVGSEAQSGIASPPPATLETPPPPVPSTTPWSSGERSTRVEERQGDPLGMEPGAHCTEYRRLPSLSYAVSTLIQDSCLELPNDTTVEVRDGATLVIVATHGLLVGKNVRLDGRGAGGHRGRRSTFASVQREVGSDAEIQALCIAQGNRCTCSSDSRAEIQGRPGEAGAPGGSVRIIVGQLVLSDKLNGFASDLSGGQGGPPGDSGSQECRRGEIRCSSPPCSAGTTFGAPGPAGTLSLAVAAGASTESLARLQAHALPAGSLTVADVGASLEQRALELDQEARQKGWQRRAGRPR
jgi:hypothetical protein